MTYTAESNWILQQHTARPGRGSVTCHRWRWVSVDTGEILETTTDSTMRNWSRHSWATLAEDPRPWGIYQNIHPTARSTNQGVAVASADYRAELQHRLTEEQADWMVREVKRPSTTFDNVFDVE